MEKQKNAFEKLKFCEYCKIFLYLLLPEDNSSKWAARRWEAASPTQLYAFIRLEKVKIEGTIMLLSSWERNENIHNNKTYSKLWFLLYIYSVTPHLGQEGREEGGRCRPSQFTV